MFCTSCLSAMLFTSVCYHDVENFIAHEKNISLGTILAGGFSRECADLTTSLGAGILERTAPF